MATLERILGDKKNEEEVREALDQLCGYMPKSVSQQCVEYVDAYAEQGRDWRTEFKKFKSISNEHGGIIQEKRQPLL